MIAGSWSRVAALGVAALGLLLTAPTARASAPDSLLLQPPTDVRARSVYDPSLRRFVVWLTFREAPDSCGAFVNPTDTTGWGVTRPPAEMSYPTARGPYTGNIDRTVGFTVSIGGQIGADSVLIRYEVRREEYLNGSLNITPAYVPGTWMPVIFRDERTRTNVDLGLQVRFGPGVVEVGGGFTVGLEDFEGFHIWRGIDPAGRDLTVIGELSKEEAFNGEAPGGSVPDSVYFNSIIPTLRDSERWFSPFGAIECLGSVIDQPLDDDQYFWFDCDARNGFTYYYAVTTFDRDYEPSSGQQGLFKFDNCTVALGQAYPCRDEMVALDMQVNPQEDLYRVFAVPNPYRSGGSRLTADNYHNYPDDFIRFVNVPASCVIRIYTVAGDLVRELNNAGGLGNVEWDTANADGQLVSSGVYVYRLESSTGDQVYGRIAIIR